MKRRRGLPDTETAPDFNTIQPDPSQVGGVAEAPFVRLPDPAPMFAARARRLRQLAPGHTLHDYLALLAEIVAAQAAAVTALPPPKLPTPEQLALRAEHAMPALSEEQVRDTGFTATLDWLLDHMALGNAPEATQDAAKAVRIMPAEERLALATGIMGSAFAADRIGESLFIGAALQVHLSRLATQLNAASVLPSEAGVCPVCGGAPVSSMVVGWTAASKARYCACSLCGTLWNHVRIKCTACGSTDGIAYLTIDAPEAEDKPKSVGVEACDKCRSYIKHMQQHEDSQLDPIADDVASYALDLLARAEDYHRSGLNPLFITG